MQKALAFIDLIGFSNMVKTNPTKARLILNDFYNIAFRIIKPERGLKCIMVSDSLIIHSSNKTMLINKVCEIYRECLKQNQHYDDLRNFFLLPRGGVSIGAVNVEQRREAPNISKGFILSPALVHSAEMEKNIKGSRFLIAVNSNLEEERQIVWSPEVETILYSQTYTFWSNYEYKDALWFADLRKEFFEQKAEVEQLINIAIDLVQNNAHSKGALQHHMETLRIGLLSFARFFEATMSSVLLLRLLREFYDEKYWLIWITIFEMIIDSPDGWVAPHNANVIEFYKKVSLTKGWVNVLNEINKPEQSHFRRLFSRFVDDMSIVTT